ncbi:MAG: hypothetical protein IPJ79_18900 [Bacteroidetes bacterium]|nr:hypothetical protein [Bacteroidota bacterium]
MTRKNFFLVFFLLIVSVLFADDSTNLNIIKQQLRNTETEKEFQKLVAKYQPHGEIILDITVYKKGRVESVFKSSCTITDRKFINELINYVKALQFDIKLKKNQKIKTQYTYSFN